MSDKPILFSAPMIRAILDGRKTVTRRVLKPQPKFGFKPWFDDGAGVWMQSGYGEAGDDFLQVKHSPGDRLWVREAWRTHRAFDHLPPRDLPFGAVAYFDVDERQDFTGRLRASMHMPRCCSRLTLIVGDVKVERLQDISEEDAISEGIYRKDPSAEDIASGCTADDFVFIAPGVLQGWGMTKEERRRDQWWPNAKGAFRLLWISIHGADAWDANPWVAAYTFRAIRANIDAPEVPRG